MKWLIVATIALVIVPQGVQAQPPGCSYCQDFEQGEDDEWRHSFGHTVGAIFNCEEALYGGHAVGCEDGPDSFHVETCADTHPACGSLLADLAEVDVREVGSLDRFLMQHAANVTFVTARREVWVRDCGGAVVAFLRVPLDTEDVADQPGD
jgi:hypothetical protein